MIRCVVFDFDGTLADSNAIKTQTFYDVVRPWDPTGAVVAEVMKSPGGDRFWITREIACRLSTRGLLGGRGVDDVAVEWAESYTEMCHQKIARCPEIPGARKILGWLQRSGRALFVNSGTPTGPLTRAVEARSIAHYFSGVYGSPADKSENLRAIEAATGTRSDEILFVGDGPDDQEGAEKFSCHFAGLIADGPGRFQTQPEWPIRELAELRSLVDRI